MINVPIDKIPDGLYYREYTLPFEKVLEDIKSKLVEGGFTVFAVIDHRKAAVSVGMDMFPASLIIFGNPSGGTNLIKESPTMAIDMPSRILVLGNGTTKVFFNKMEYVKERHSPGENSEAVSKFDLKVIGLLENLA